MSGRACTTTGSQAVTEGDYIALSHCLWARRAGFSPRQVIESVGDVATDDPSWEEALAVIAAAHLRMSLPVETVWRMMVEGSGQ